jgi:hypothetical protein
LLAHAGPFPAQPQFCPLGISIAIREPGNLPLDGLVQVDFEQRTMKIDTGPAVGA